jgi:hypothetical protein
MRCGVDDRDGSIGGECSAWIVDPAVGGPQIAAPSLPIVPIGGIGGWDADGWFTVAVRITDDGTMYFTYHPVAPHPWATDDDWRLVDPTAKLYPEIFPSRPPVPSMMRAHPENASSVFDLWKYEWRRL